MQKEQIQEFTRRISQSNRSGLTVLTYEIFFTYLMDAKEALLRKEEEAYGSNIRHAIQCINRLEETLDFSYALAGELYRIYTYCKELLSMALYKGKTEEIDTCEQLMKKLYDSFCEVAKTDTSAPLMENSQQVQAGYTYGKHDINENYTKEGQNRGFFA